MSAEKNKALVCEWVEEGWVKKNLAAAEKYYDAEYVLHLPGFPEIRGPGEGRQVIGGLQEAFPDVTVELDEDSMVADAERVAVRFVCSGTHKAEFTGVPATGKHVSWEGMSIFRIAGGKFVEEWELLDAAGLMHQLTAD
nr:Glr0227 protein family protein [uncultured bacterium]